MMRLGSKERTNALREKLSQVAFPPQFQLPLDSEMVFERCNILRCRVMSSKKAPLWLNFRDVRGRDVPVLFKRGDDLRQDQLTLQIFETMKSLWDEAGLDMRFKTYSVVPTSSNTGFIEVVPNSCTLAGIVRRSGNSSGKISNALKVMFGTKVLLRHLRKMHRERKDGSANQPFSDVLDNFMRSCAGYCVATYVLGIGDRHNDNIMLSDDGHLFHIDFGHFLGNFKSKMGIKRERAPFVFTPSMAHVIKSQGAYGAFKELCCDAFEILRKNSHLLISLFQLMTNAGIPELVDDSDIAYLESSLMVGKSEAYAREKFLVILRKCLNSTTTTMNHAVHMLAH